MRGTRRFATALAACSGSGAERLRLGRWGGDAGSGFFKLGFINIVRGPVSAIGKSTREGVELAVDEINEAGGVDGRDLEPIFERRLGPSHSGDRPQAPVVGGARSRDRHATDHSSAPLAPTLRSVQIPTPIYASAMKATDEGRPWVFRFIPNSESGAGNVVTCATDQRGFTKLGIVYESTDFGKGGADAIEAAREEKGITPVAVETIDVDATDDPEGESR